MLGGAVSDFTRIFTRFKGFRPNFVVPNHKYDGYCNSVE